VLNDRNITNSFQRLLYVIANINPPNDPSKNRLAADLQLLPWDTQVLKHASVLMLRTLLPYPRCVRGPPMVIFASAGDIVLLPSCVVPILGTTNDGRGAAAAAFCIALCSSSDN